MVRCFIRKLNQLSTPLEYVDWRSQMIYPRSTVTKCRLVLSQTRAQNTISFFNEAGFHCVLCFLWTTATSAVCPTLGGRLPCRCSNDVSYVCMYVVKYCVPVSRNSTRGLILRLTLRTCDFADSDSHSHQNMALKTKTFVCSEKGSSCSVPLY